MFSNFTDRIMLVEQLEREILWADKGVRLGATQLDRERSAVYKMALEMSLAAARSDVAQAQQFRNKLRRILLPVTIAAVGAVFTALFLYH